MGKRIIVLLSALALSVFAGHSQELSLSTNLVEYANLGTLNMGFSYGFARHWSTDAELKYNPFTYGDGDGIKFNRQQTLSAGVRFWPWHIFSGWWLSGHARYQEYATGGVYSAESSEGDRFGAAIAAGYSLLLTPHLNLDFGLGVWGGYEYYTTYSCPRCGKRLDSGEKYFLLPSDLLLTLAFVF